MKNLIFLMTVALITVSCASGKRGPASGCYVEQHPTKKDLYRPIVHSKPFNKYWYSEKNAERIVEKKCK